MIDASLVPEHTLVTANGDSAPLDITSAVNRNFLLTLTITGVVEQESIEVSVFTSADGAVWDAKPVASLPQKFYVGEYPLLVNLESSASATFIRAHWEVNRWGRGSTAVHFKIGIRFRDVPAEMLKSSISSKQV
jgi:hypothetical protein